MTHLEREIQEQPDVIQRLLSEQTENARHIAQAIREFDPAYVMIAARGTSDNAARYAQYLLGIHANLPVALAAPSIHTLYEAPPILKKALVIGISQSGKAADVRQVVDDARAQGALTVTMTNDPESPLAQAATHHLALSAGEEISVAATKTYTAQLTAIAMIMAALVDDAELQSLLNRLPVRVAETLALSETIADWVERYRYINHFVALGRGYNYSTAFEVSLKVKELCYISSIGYSEADFRHGPIAMMQPGFPAFVIAPTGKTHAVVSDLISKLHERQAELLVVSNDEATFTHATKAMKLPKDTVEWLSPILSIIPGQLFAMRLAEAKGHPIDQPHGLTKVTVTK